MATPTNGNDRLFGTPFANLIDALDGDDADVLHGEIGNDRLVGGTGIDQFWGGADSDRFVLQNRHADRDVIRNWQAGNDKLEIKAALFGGGLQQGNSLDRSKLAFGTQATPAGIGQFIFNTTNGVLRWDADGAGGAGPQTIATRTGVTTLSASEFLIA